MNLSYQCNICDERNIIKNIEYMQRESAKCWKCHAWARPRAIVHALSSELFGKSITLPSFPFEPNIKGIGLSDWEGYALPLSKKLGYTNTYYHKDPKLDITNITEWQEGKYDFLICSDVFEHINPPSQ